MSQLRIRRDWRAVLPFLGLAVLGLIVPLLLTKGFELRLASLVCIYAMLSMAFNLLYGFAGQVSMGQQAFFAIAAYAYALLQLKGGMSPWAAMPLSLAICALVSLPIGAALLRLRTHYLAMATLCFSLVVAGVANRWIDVTGGTAGLLLPSLAFDGKPLPRAALYLLVLAATLLVLGLQNFIIANHLGRSMRAIREDERAAATLGVDVTMLKLRVFVLSSVIAGLAGIAFAVVSRQVSPSFGEFPVLVSVLTIAVVGGLGTRYGPVLGAIVVVLAPQFLSRVGDYETLIYGGCLLLFLIFLPHGLSGLIERLTRRRNTAPAGPVATLGVPTPPSGMLPRSSTRTPIEAPALLTIVKGTRRFGGLLAVDDVSFEVRRGEAIGLIGPNGAGKSTTFNLLSGVDRLSSGDIVYERHSITRQPLHRRSPMGMARTFQIVRLFGGMTVLQNVMLGFHPKLVDGFVKSLLMFSRVAADEAACVDKAMRLLHFVGLAERAGDLIGHLSHGQQRLVEIARALASEPKVLLLDEPAAGLNDEETRTLGGMLRALNDEGLTILIVEHDIEFIMSLCHRIIVLDRGAKIAEGAAAAIQNDPLVIEAYLGAPHAAH